MMRWMILLVALMAGTPAMAAEGDMRIIAVNGERWDTPDHRVIVGLRVGETEDRRVVLSPSEARNVAHGLLSALGLDDPGYREWVDDH